MEIREQTRTSEFERISSKTTDLKYRVFSWKWFKGVQKNVAICPICVQYPAIHRVRPEVLGRQDRW